MSEYINLSNYAYPFIHVAIVRSVTSAREYYVLRRMNGGEVKFD